MTSVNTRVKDDPRGSPALRATNHGSAQKPHHRAALLGVLTPQRQLGKAEPGLIVPTAAVVVAFVDCLISFVILIGIMIGYRHIPGWQILTLPLFVLMAFLASLGPGLS